MQYTAVVDEEGEVSQTMGHPTLFRAKLLQFVADKCPYRTVTVQLKPSYVEPRSSQQNRWLWGPCYTAIQMYLFENWGKEFTTGAIHKYMVKKLAPKKDITVVLNGVEYISTDPVRSSHMTTQEFTQFMDAIILYWGERGLEIPLPEKTDEPYQRFRSL